MPVAKGLGGGCVSVEGSQLGQGNRRVPTVPRDQHEHIAGAVLGSASAAAMINSKNVIRGFCASSSRLQRLGDGHPPGWREVLGDLVLGMLAGRLCWTLGERQPGSWFSAECRASPASATRRDVATHQAVNQTYIKVIATHHR